MTDLSSRPSAPPLPTTVKAAIAAVGAMILFSLLEALSAFGSTATFTKLLEQTNAKAKTPKNPYTAQQIAHDLHQFRTGTLIQAVVVSIAFVLLAMTLRSVRSASIGRWALIVIIVVTGQPFTAIPAKGWPVAAGTFRILEGVSSLAVIVLLLLPASAAYFRQCKQLAHPGSTPRPNPFGAMFRPRPAAAPQTTRPASTAVPTANPSANKAKAKVRADEASAAKGAELARNRAKAAKSRKPDA